MNVNKVLKMTEEKLSRQSTDWLERALESLRGELSRSTREFKQYPETIDSEVREIMKNNSALLSSLVRYTTNKRNALLGWLYIYMERGNAVERAVEKYRFRPLRKMGRTDEIIRLLSTMHKWNKRPSRRVANYVHDIIIETRYADRWKSYNIIIRREITGMPPLSTDNIRDVLLSLINLKSNEEKSIRGSINVLAKVLPERYGTWAPRFNDYRREILGNIKKLKNILSRYLALEKHIRTIEEKIKEIEELLKVAFEIIRTGISFYYILTGTKGYPCGVFQGSFSIDAMYSSKTGIVYTHPLTLRELEACKLFFINSWFGAEKIFSGSVSTDIKGFFVPEGVTFGKDNTAERVDRPKGAVCLNIRRMNLRIWDVRARPRPKFRIIPNKILLRERVPSEIEYLANAQRALTDFIEEYKSRPEPVLDGDLEPSLEFSNEFGRWELSEQWEGKARGVRGPFGIWGMLPEEEFERIGVTFEVSPEGALIYKPTPEEEEKMILDKKRRQEEW